MMKQNGFAWKTIIPVSYTHLDVYKRQPLTSEAVKMTLEAVVTHLGPQNGAFGKLTTLFDELETPDEKTFVMTLKTPYYAALDNLTMALPLGIVNPAACLLYTSRCV